MRFIASNDRLFKQHSSKTMQFCCCEIIDVHPVVKLRFVFYDWASGHHDRTFEMATWQNTKGLRAKRLWPHTTCFLFAISVCPLLNHEEVGCLVLYKIVLGYENSLNRLVEVWFIGEILNISILSYHVALKKRAWSDPNVNALEIQNMWQMCKY